MFVKIRTTFEKMSTCLDGYLGERILATDNEANLLFTGAKAYYRGAGWWHISGYHYAGEDVSRVLNRLQS